MNNGEILVACPGCKTEHEYGTLCPRCHPLPKHLTTKAKGNDPRRNAAIHNQEQKPL